MHRRNLIRIIGLSTFIPPSSLFISCNPKKEVGAEFREDYLNFLFAQYKFQQILTEKKPDLPGKLLLAYLPKNLVDDIAYTYTTRFQFARVSNQAEKIIDECSKLADRKTPYYDFGNPAKFPEASKFMVNGAQVGATLFITSGTGVFLVAAGTLVSNALIDSMSTGTNQVSVAADYNPINNCTIYKLSELAFKDDAYKNKVLKIDTSFLDRNGFVDENLKKNGLSSEARQELTKEKTGNQFKDDAIAQFEVAISEQNLLLESVISHYSEMQAEQERIAERQVAVARIGETCTDIENFGNVMGHVLGTVFGFKKEAQQLVTLSKGVSLMLNAASMFSIGAMSPMSFASQMTNSMAILGSLMGGGPSFEEQVLMTLNSIQKQLNAISKTLERIEKLQLQILKKLEEFIEEVKADFNQVNFKLDGIRQRIMASYNLQLQIARSNTRDDFVENILLLKSLFEKDVSEESVKTRLNDVNRHLFSYAKFRSRSVSFIGNSTAASSLQLITDEFKTGGFLDLSIGLLSPLFSHTGIRHAGSENRLCNPYEWAIGTNALLEGLYMTRHFRGEGMLKYLQELKTEGESINTFINDVINIDTLTQCIKNVEDAIKYDSFNAFEDSDIPDVYEFKEHTFGSLLETWLNEFHQKFGYESYTLLEYKVHRTLYSNETTIEYHSHNDFFGRLSAVNDPFDRCLELELLRIVEIEEELDKGRLYNIVDRSGKDFIPEFGKMIVFQDLNYNAKNVTTRALGKNIELLGKDLDRTGVHIEKAASFLSKCFDLLADYYIACTKTKLNNFLLQKRVADSVTISMVNQFEVQHFVCKAVCSYSLWKNTVHEMLPLQYQLNDGIVSYNPLIDEQSKTQHILNTDTITGIEDFFLLLQESMADQLWTNSPRRIRNRIISEFRKIVNENVDVYKRHLTKIDKSSGLPIVNSTIRKIDAAIFLIKLP